MTEVQRHTSTAISASPEAASRPLLELVSRFQNRLEDGDRPGHKLISAGLAPTGEERAVLIARKQHLIDSLQPPASPEETRAMARVVTLMLGAFPTFGASREDATAMANLICRALDDVPIWAVQRASANFLKGVTKIAWNPERAPTPPQIRSEAKLAVLDVETELHRIGQILNAELVDNETTDDERREALERWAQLRREIGASNVIRERSQEDIDHERAEQRRANERVRQRALEEKRKAETEGAGAGA